MKYTKFYPFAVLLLFILSQSVLGQKLYNIEIKFSGTDVSKKSIDVQVIQGFQTIPLNRDSSNVISEVIESPAKYPVVEISYFSSKYSPSIQRYFLAKQNCRLVVHYDKDADIINIEQTSGVISFEDGGFKEFENFAKTEIEKRDAFLKLYNNDFTEVDSSVRSNFTNHMDAIEEKGIQFIKKYPDLLFSTWFFMFEIIGDPKYSKEELLDIYNKSLKTGIEGTFEEKLILEILDPNRLDLNTKAPLQKKILKI